MSIKSTANSLTTNQELSKVLGTVFGDRYHSHQSIGGYVNPQMGGAADHMVVAESTSDLVAAAQAAFDHGVAYKVIGRGTGVLASDFGFPGLIIVNQTKNMAFAEHCSQVVTDSGVNNDQLVNTAAARQLGGMEFLAAVPGTIGGAVATSATWSGKSISSIVKEAVIYLPKAEKGEIVTISSSQLFEHPYQPVFSQESKAPPVILTLRLQLAQTAVDEILRRLLAIRKSRRALTRGRLLGHIFIQTLEEVPLPREVLKSPINGVKVEPKSKDIISCDQRVTAQHVYRFIIWFKGQLKAAGISLDDRIDYLGYWQDDVEGDNA